ncbi:MAG: hypothetical protein K0R54_5092 [Clostridiaceae bacterium]|jgi:transcriptional regulator with XRE-family HTH domain|nr:hypothetical protein [Clostridiaceae bacterium]
MIGNNIKKIREKMDINQRTLAKLANITYEYLNRIENGKMNNPSLDVLDKLAKALRCSVSDLTNTSEIKEDKELTVAKALKETYLNSNKEDANKPTSQTVTDLLVKRLIQEGIIDEEGNMSSSDLKLLEEAIKLDAKLNNNLKKSSE